MTDTGTDPSNKSYRKILAAAKSLFWKHGFKRVSVEEICAEAGVSKMTFYRFFPNKLALAKTVFDAAVDEGRQNFAQVISSEASAEEKVRSMVQAKLEGTHQISREFLQDFYKDPALGLKEHIEEKTRMSWTDMLAQIRSAQEQGVFRADIRPEFMFFIARKMGDMIGDEGLMCLYPDPQAVIMELTKFFCYGVAGSGEKKSQT